VKLAGRRAHVRRSTPAAIRARPTPSRAAARERGVKARSPLSPTCQARFRSDAMVGRALSEFGRHRILLNNAAIRPHKPFREGGRPGLGGGQGGVPRRGDAMATGRSSPRWSQTAMGGSVLQRRGRLHRGGGQMKGSLVGGENGPGRARACASQSNSRATIYAQCRLPAASIPTRQLPSGIAASRRAPPPGFPLGRQGQVDELVPPACSWTATTAASSQGPDHSRPRRTGFY